jgi:hypothetical protein
MFFVTLADIPKKDMVICRSKNKNPLGSQMHNNYNVWGIVPAG